MITKTPFNPETLEMLAMYDAQSVTKKNQEYGESWCRRGGQQAFAVIWRKVDRIESIMAKMDNGFDIFAAWDENPGDIRDDIRDLRTYLLLLEEYMIRAVRTEFDTGVPQAHGYVDQD